MADPFASRATTLIELFKNALVYTTVLRNVDALIQDKDDSILIIIMATSLATFGVYVAEQQLVIMINDPLSPWRYMPPLGKFAALGELVIFLVDTTGNILVQLTSSLAATLAIKVFASADSFHWGIVGAIMSLSLLWVLQRVVVGAKTM